MAEVWVLVGKGPYKKERIILPASAQHFSLYTTDSCDQKPAWLCVMSVCRLMSVFHRSVFLCSCCSLTIATESESPERTKIKNCVKKDCYDGFGEGNGWNKVISLLPWSAKQSNNWPGFWKSRFSQEKNVSTQAGREKMRSNLLIICLLWCFKLQGRWSETEPQGAATKHHIAYGAFSSLNINTLLIILVVFSSGEHRMFTHHVFLWNWYRLLWCVCYCVSSFSSWECKN